MKPGIFIVALQVLMLFFAGLAQADLRDGKPYTGYVNGGGLYKWEQQSKLYYAEKRSGKGLWLEDSDQYHITIYSKEPFYREDHNDVVELIPENYMAFQGKELPSGRLSLKEVSFDISRKPGSKKAYYNKYFHEILFIKQELEGIGNDSDWDHYLIQASHTASEKVYYFIAYVSDFIPRTIGLEGRGVFEIFIYGDSRRETPGISPEVTEINFTELHMRAHSRISNASLISLQNDAFGLTLAPVGARDEILVHLNEYNGQSKEKGSYVFNGKFNDIEDDALFLIGQRLVKPICYQWSDGLALVKEAGGAKIYFDASSCLIQTFFGELEIVTHSHRITDCQPGYCNVSMIIDCRSRGAPFLEACVDFKQSMREKYGPNQKVVGSLIFDWRGKIERYSSIRNKP